MSYPASATAWPDRAVMAAFDDAPLSAASKQTYKASVRMLLRCKDLSSATHAGASSSASGATSSLLQWLASADAAWAAICTEYSALRTRQQAAKTVLAVWKYTLGCGGQQLQSGLHSDACEECCANVHERWHAILREVDQAVRDIVASSELSAREAAGWVSYAEVRAAEVSLRRQYGSPRHLLLAFAALTEPFRGGDLGRVRLCTPGTVPPGGNYLQLSSTTDASTGDAVLVLREHKTAHARSIGALRRVLPQQLKEVVVVSVQQMPREWLFNAPRGGPFSEEAHFIAWANRQYRDVFDRPVTANILRHAFISAIDVSKTSTAALEATAARFGHSLTTQMAYRRLSPGRTRKAPAGIDAGNILVAMRSAGSDSEEAESVQEESAAESEDESSVTQHGRRAVRGSSPKRKRNRM